MDDGTAERDVRGCVARDSGEPTVAESHVGNFHERRLPEPPRARSNEAESGRQERSSALCPHRGALIHLPAGETGLAELSSICWTLLRWRSTDINANQFADRLFQGS